MALITRPGEKYFVDPLASSLSRTGKYPPSVSNVAQSEVAVLTYGTTPKCLQIVVARSVLPVPGGPKRTTCFPDTNAARAVTYDCFSPTRCVGAAENALAQS